jgi:hypothetical protein
MHSLQPKNLMSPVLLAGVIIVNLALVSYSVAIIMEQRKKSVNVFVLTILTIGVVFDITATICMIIGSANSFATLHGLLGYSALAAMTVDAVLLWKHRLTHRTTIQVGNALNLYTRYAYAWWVIAYITGALIVAMK